MNKDARVTTPRRLMKKVEQVVDALAQGEAPLSLHSVLDHLIQDFRDQLGLYGARLYARDGDDYELVATFGEAKVVSAGLRVPAAYPPIKAALTKGVVYMSAEDPGADARFEGEQLGVGEFAAVSVDNGRNILGFNAAPGSHREDILMSLGIVRHAVSQMLQRQRVAHIFREAREIQLSILPKQAPTFPPFDIAGCSTPLESVGGDLYDFIPITDNIIGLAIADAIGHGLPAALQVRDIYMGLRMGLARDLKIVRTAERLNRIIHLSTRTSRFVSLFYGELEASGTFIYVNAGHPPPFHLNAEGKVRELDQGGAVLGPLPDATYDRGFVRLRPGDVMVAYTDGITEAVREGRNEPQEEYGTERLLAVVKAHRQQPAKAIVAAIAADVNAWSGDAPAQDDRTVVVVRYPQD